MAPRSSDGVLEVFAVVQVQGLRVDTENMVLQAVFNLSLNWRDPRVVFYNLKDDPSLNSLQVNGSVWLPHVAFTNSLNSDNTQADEKATLLIVKEKLSGTDVPQLPEEGDHDL